jgi:hypothetical protein
MTPELVQTIVDQVQKSELNDGLIAELRQTYPDVHFTYCMDDDITNPHPVLECQGFNVYLVGGDGHCLALTKDYETASGLVLAEVIEEE